MKPGYKTTEFWLTAAVHMLTMFMAAGIFPDTHVVAKVCAFALSALAQLGYTMARAKSKAAPGTAEPVNSGSFFIQDAGTVTRTTVEGATTTLMPKGKK